VRGRTHRGEPFLVRLAHGEAPCERSDTPRGFEYSSFRKGAARDSGDDGVDRTMRELRGMAHEERVHAGFESLQHDGVDRVMVRDRLHLEIVAEDDAPVPETLAQKRAQDGGAHGGRPLHVERLEHHVRRHDRRDPRRHRRRERDELHFFQSR
jgi:hypothetical protein